MRADRKWAGIRKCKTDLIFLILGKNFTLYRKVASLVQRTHVHLCPGFHNVNQCNYNPIITKQGIDINKTLNLIVFLLISFSPLQDPIPDSTLYLIVSLLSPVCDYSILFSQGQSFMILTLSMNTGQLFCTWSLNLRRSSVLSRLYVSKSYGQ